MINPNFNKYKDFSNKFESSKIIIKWKLTNTKLNKRDLIKNYSNQKISCIKINSNGNRSAKTHKYLYNKRINNFKRKSSNLENPLLFTWSKEIKIKIPYKSSKNKQSHKIKEFQI